MKVKAGKRLDNRHWILDALQAPEIKHRESSIRQRFLLFVFCFLTSLINLVVASDKSSQVSASTRGFIKSSQDVNAPKISVANKSSQNSLNSVRQAQDKVASKPRGEVTNKLQKNGINVQKNVEDENRRMELQRIIEQIRSIRFEPESPTSASASIDEQDLIRSQKELEKTSSVTEETQQTIEKEESKIELGSGPLSGRSSMDELLYQPVSAQTLQMLENFTRKPDQLNNPIQLADILFLSGHLEQATVFYRQALNCIDVNDVTSVQDRAWILFQMGNCLWEENLSEAKKIYRQLLEEYPNCLWADTARCRESLIDWFLSDKPQKLIDENKL
jgi:tetratricopeptide (TPR) repeat protein